jgi:hypothetical protein
MRKMLLAGVLAATAITAGPAALAQPGQCFFVNQWEGWKAPNDHTIYLGVTGHRVYRLDLTGSCAELTWPGARLISRDRGSGSICGPLDFDLKVAVQGGPGVPCIVKSMTPLTADEASALPRSVRP